MPPTTTLRIACASGAAWAPHCAAMLHSVLTHAPGRSVEVNYLAGPDFATSDEALMAGMVEGLGGSIEFHRIAERVATMPTLDHVPTNMWLKIYLPELLPDADRVLCLDVDTIAVDSLVPLWETDLTDSYVAAVTNVFQLDHLGLVAALGIEDPRDYFNSGVMLLNLDLMRRDDCMRRLHELATDPEINLQWADQDALNLVLGPRRLALHPRWNCTNAVLNFEWSQYVFGSPVVSEARRNPAIRHFEGHTYQKPWHLLCDGELHERYAEHRSQTPWPRWRPDGITAPNLLRRGGRSLRWHARRALPGRRASGA